MIRSGLVCAGGACVLGMGALMAFSQVDSASRSILKGAAIEYLFPEQVTVPAGKATDVALHFRIADGLHVNSHTPREEFLIPTSFSLPDNPDVQLKETNYPTGSDMTLESDPGNKVSVYTGEFVIQTKLIASAGDHLVEAKLHFQACNNNTCMPPKTIPVTIDVIGK
jgi:hypothetical protein